MLASLKKIEPPRIAFYPGKILDVITWVPQFDNSSTATDLPSLEKSTNLASQDLPLALSNTTTPPFNSSLTTRNNGQTDMISSEKGIQLLQKIDKKSDEVLKLQSEILRLQQEAKKKNDEMLKMQMEMFKLQQEAKAKDDEMLKLQHQALDRLAILQKHANAILIQNFELHEYPIPRLFIVLPVDTTKWDPMNALRSKVRLYFLCECGEHTVDASKSRRNEIHIAKHEGYEIRNSTEFFRKYGRYMFILLQCLKIGAPLANPLAPASDFSAAIDSSIKYMEAISDEHSALSKINTIDNCEALEGADLRQLNTFLQTTDEGKQLGNLYRITTEAGYVKWVCLDHYRSTYREEEQRAFEKTMQWNGGEYDSHLGKVIITLKSRTTAGEFFDALAKARRVYELDITFSWSWTKADLEAFEEVIKRSSVSALHLKFGEFQESTTRKLLSTSTRYEILVRIMELINLRTIDIVLPPNLIELSNLRPKRSPYLKDLSVRLRPRKMATTELRVLLKSLKADPALTSLDLRDNSIGNGGALALSEALKTNKTLTTLDLMGNSIGKEGALALLEALKVNRTLLNLDLDFGPLGKEGALLLSKINTTLTTLNFSSKPIGEEGACAISEALKANTTLTSLNLNHASIGKEGALALSKALKANWTLTNLNLGGNSIGAEGALSLSEALKANLTLVSLNLNYNPIGHGGALALSEALKTNTALTTLDLGSNSIGEEGVLALSEALKANSTLVSLDLSSNSIRKEGAVALSEALKANTTLTALDLRYNSIGDEGALALSEALKARRTLTSLNLSSNSIKKEGVLALSRALKTNWTLTTLDLTNNSAGDEGALALSEALKTNCTLTTLNLYCNAIEKEGALALSEALKTNSTLTSLDLDNNPIGNGGAVALSEALKINRTLKKLYLRYNSIENEGRVAMIEANEVNAGLDLDTDLDL
ncbi:hypothetical protein BX616_000889, partial [Lobosporangium transversale]